MRTAHPGPRGFTLIEMAIVLAVISLIAVAATTAAVALIASTRQKVTRQNEDTIKVALQNFISRNGRLPCPAVRSNTPSDATFGLEAPTTGTCTGATDLGTGSPTPGVFGTVPWKSIGLSPEAAIDGWNNQFDYAVTRTATNTSFATVGAMRGILTLHSDAPAVLGLPATGNQLNACSTTANDNSCNLFAAAIIISHGSNGLGARSWYGASQIAPTSNRELANTGTGTAFVLADYSEVAATYFDDVITALTPADAIASLIAQGGVKTEYAALQEKFKTLVTALATSAAASRTTSSGSKWRYWTPQPTGGSSSYSYNASNFNSDCNQGNPPSGIKYLPTSMQTILDPWGNQFRYQYAESTVEVSETCPNYAIIVSSGPDGNILTTSDNTVYYVSKAEFDALLATNGWYY